MFNAQMTRFAVALHNKITSAVKDDKGATAVEYGLIVGLIAVVIIGAVGTLGQTLFGWFSDINGSLGGTP